VRYNHPTALSTQHSTAVQAPSIIQHRSDWGEAVDVSLFCGRLDELATLKRWVLQDRCRLVTLLGMGGIGKTTLVTKLAEQVEDQFEVLIWRSLRNAPTLTELLNDLLKFTSNQQITDLPESIAAKFPKLMDYLRQHRCLVVLDNLETLMQGGTHPFVEGWDSAMFENAARA